MATKAATKKVAKAKEEKEPVDRSLVQEPPAALGKAIVAAREKHEQNWAEIAEANGISVGKAMFIYMQMTAEKIDGTPAKVAQAIVKARSNGESWGMISARTGRTEGWCRRMWEEKTGESASGNRVGKGGRYPGDENPNAEDGDDKPKAKKAPAKKAAAKKAPAKKAPSKLADMDLEQIQERLNGKRLTMKDGVKIVVGEVQSIEDGEIVFTDEDGDIITTDLSEIKSATR